MSDVQDYWDAFLPLWYCRGITVTIACPGPIATGSEGTPRNVFSAQVLTNLHISSLHPSHDTLLLARHTATIPCRMLIAYSYKPFGRNFSAFLHTCL